MVRIAVIYHSVTGNTAELAHAVAAGCEKAGAETRVLRASAPSPDDKPPGASEDPIADLAALEWADGLAIGTPTRFGLVSAEMKGFLDRAGPLWQRGALADKAVTAFTAAHTPHGGHETTIASLYNVFTHWGCVIVPLGYTDPEVFTTGNPYGSPWSSDGRAGPDAATLDVARHQGRRLARIAALLRGEPAPGDTALTGSRGGGAAGAG